MANKNDDLYTSTPRSHSLGFRSAGNVTIDCWWRYNDQTIVTRAREKWYLTRYIDFIHGDIHGRLCKKMGFNIIKITQWP